MKKNFVLSAFSLMEMMIVLLIVAIIAAASAPMIAKKMMRQTGTGDSPWVFTGTNNSIAFNMRNNNTDTVYIGTDNNNNTWNADPIDNPPLCIQTRFRRDGVNNLPENTVGITFENDRRVIGHLGISPDTGGDTGSVFFSNIIPGRTCAIFGGGINYQNLRNGGAGSDSNKMERKIIFGQDIINTDREWNNVNSGNGGVFSRDVLLGHNLHIFSSISDNNGPNWDRFQRNANLVAGTDINRQNNNNSFIHDSVLLGNGLEYGPNNINSVQLNRIIGIGSNNTIENDNGIAIGSNITASGANAIAIGDHNTAGSRSIAIGTSADSSNTSAITIGFHNANHTQGAQSIAIGTDAQASSQGSIAIGNTALTSGRGDAIAIGTQASATGENSIAIGSNARTTGDNSVAIGAGANANANQIVLGKSVDSPTVIIPGDLTVKGSVKVTIMGRQYTLGINQSSPNAHLSDIRLKNLGEKFTSGLDEIKKLEFFNYTFKDDKEKSPHVGVIAQDLQKVFPISVTEGADGYLRIRLDEMFYAALNAIKELDQKLVELKAKVVSYFDRVEKLEAQIEEQQKMIDALKAQNAEFKKRLTKIEKKKLKNTKISESEAE